MPEHCAAHRSPGEHDWELIWRMFLGPSQTGLFLCDAGHYVVVQTADAEPEPEVSPA